jgi:putative oxidoreductase
MIDWPLLADLRDEISLLVRWVVGVTFIYYGWPKIKNLRQNARDFEGMGFKPGIVWGTLVAGLEFFGSLALMLGVYVWLVSAGLVIHMTIGSIWKITKTDKPFSDWSYDVLLATLAIVLLMLGSGSYVLI